MHLSGLLTGVLSRVRDADANAMRTLAPMTSHAHITYLSADSSHDLKNRGFVCRDIIKQEVTCEAASVETQAKSMYS